MAIVTVIIRVLVGPDKASYQAFIDRAKIVGGKAPTTELYATDPGYRLAVDGLAKGGADLAIAEDKVLKLEADLAEARRVRDGIYKTTEKSYDVAVTHVEASSPTPAEIAAQGFVPLEPKPRSTGPLPSLLGLTAEWNSKKSLLVIRADRGKSRRPVIVEFSPSPATPGSYQKADGSGATRKVPGLSYGDWCVRAAISGANANGPWFGPIVVTIR